MYLKKSDVIELIDKLSNTNLLGNDNDTFISVPELLDGIEELEVII